jgi:hypothetical protein
VRFSLLVVATVSAVHLRAASWLPVLALLLALYIGTAIVRGRRTTLRSQSMPA